MKTFFAALAAAAGLLAAPVAASAAGVAYPDANWTQAAITASDGVKLHADVLRPKGAAADEKLPVIISVGPYFSHSGQVGPAGPVQDAGYDPVGPSSGPSERFQDFVEGAKLFTRGQKYAFVMVDNRGYGGSTGCPDWGGPGETADVVAAVKWAVEQPWSNGNVGTYGKSYDGMTGLMGAAARAPGLKAVVAQEPVYDNYRYLYGDGIRRLNSFATPALYDAIAATPGPVADIPGNPTYNVDGSSQDASRPGCFAGNWTDQAGNDDHSHAYWKQRNLIEKVKGSTVPVFVMQGMTENNTAPDGLAEFLQNHDGPQRGWLGPWNHVRCDQKVGGALAMGRADCNAELMRWYDKYLAGIEPAIQDPPFAIQSVTTGKWRAEVEWPPSDAVAYSTPLATGTYTDNARSSGASGTFPQGPTDSGVWTVSKPLAHDVHMAGAAQITIDVASPTPRSNLVADIYDLDATGKGPLVARQGALIRQNGPITLHMMSADWRFAAGHRIGVRITDNNSEWWVAAIPTMQTVTVKSGSVSLPLLTYNRTRTIEGKPGAERNAYLGEIATAPAAAVTAAKDFVLPGPLQPLPADLAAQLASYK